MNPIRRKTSEGGASATAARRRVRRPAVAVAALALGVASAPLQATTVADPSGDFLATYVGPKNADLDIVRSTATFDGTTFRLSTTVAGSVGDTPGVFYAWGINRGAGTALFATGSPVIGSTVLFDTIAVMLADGSGRIVTFPTPNVFEDFSSRPSPAPPRSRATRSPACFRRRCCRRPASQSPTTRSRTGRACSGSRQRAT